MSSSPPRSSAQSHPLVVVADRDEDRRRLIVEAIRTLDTPTETLIETTPEELSTAVEGIAQPRQGVLAFLSLDEGDELSYWQKAKQSWPTRRVFSVAVVDPTKQELIEQAYSAGVGACVESGDEVDGVDRLQTATRFAFDVVEL